MLIPPRRKHLQHYHGAFAPNAPLRKSISSYANKALFEPPKTRLSKMAERVEKASLTWAELIKRIYEDDPLKCPFGHKMKITGFVTNPVSIKHILLKMGLSRVSPELEEGIDWEVCQLFPGTPDGYYEEIDIVYRNFEDSSGSDPPINRFREAGVHSKEKEEWEYSQLVPWTTNGFYEEIDPPFEETEYLESEDGYLYDIEPV
jgi:hypothetical protein